PVKVSFSAEDYSKLYIKEIVKLHGVPFSITLDTDGQAECTIQTLDHMLRAWAIDFKGNWEDHLPFIEFAYNNSYHSSIIIGLFEALYGRRCRSLVRWFEVGEFSLIGPELVYDAIEKVRLIRERLKTAQSRNLSPRYVGPYQILKRVGKVAYELDLPNKLTPIHPVFHVSMLKKCIGDQVSILPLQGLGDDENLSYEEISVEILVRQVKRLRNKEVASGKVLWRNHLVKGSTWDAETDMKSPYPYLFPSTYIQT
ncbi:hypothetical protein MTR67_012006, partial [Solanum verrucosum]